jgi:hypothetical protein
MISHVNLKFKSIEFNSNFNWDLIKLKNYKSKSTLIRWNHLDFIVVVSLIIQALDVQLIKGEVLRSLGFRNRMKCVKLFSNLHNFELHHAILY